MSARAASAPGAGVLDRLQVLRSAPTPLRGAPAATWTPSPRTGVGPLRVPGPGLQPSSHDTTTTRTDPAGSTLARPDFGPKDGVHLRATTYYRLANPTLSDSNPTLNVAKEVTKEGTEEVQKQRTVGKPTETSPKVAEKGQSRLRSSPHSAQQRMVAAIAEKLNLPDLLTAAGLEEFDELENTKKQALIWRLLRAEKRHDRRVAQTRSGRLQRKYADRRTPDPPPRPDPPPMTHETRVELEANARASGFHLIGGKWMKL